MNQTWASRVHSAAAPSRGLPGSKRIVSAVNVEYLLLPEVRRSCDVHEGSHELCPSEIGVLDWVQPLGVVKDAIRVSFRRAVNELSVEYVVELARFQISLHGLLTLLRGSVHMTG